MDFKEFCNKIIEMCFSCEDGCEECLFSDVLDDDDYCYEWILCNPEEAKEVLDKWEENQNPQTKWEKYAESMTNLFGEQWFTSPKITNTNAETKKENTSNDDYWLRSDESTNKKLFEMEISGAWYQGDLYDKNKPINFSEEKLEKILGSSELSKIARDFYRCVENEKNK